MFASTKIAELQTQVSTLEAQIKASNEDLTSLRASFEEQGEKLTAASEKSAADASRIAELEASEATFEARVSAEVTERLAALGTEPIKRDPNAKNDDAKEITRAEFKKLKPSAQAAFCASGGKIKD